MLSEVGELFVNTADRIFSDIATPANLAEAEAGRWRAEDWQTMSDAGLPRALISEDAGGYGLDIVEALVLVRRAGFFALPFPLAETMIANRLLGEAGWELPDGPISIATGAKGDYLRLAKSNGGWQLRGELRRVPWARFADGIVAVASLGDSHSLVFVPRRIFTVANDVNLAGEPRDSVKIDGVVAAESVSEKPSIMPFQLRLTGAALRSIAIAGAVERLLEMTITYATERVQFGRAIAKFQAIQQNLAVFAGNVAAAIASAEMAAESLASNLPALPIAISKVQAGLAAGEAAAIAHQVHGAMGITHEYAGQFFTRRLWSWRDEFGNETEWARLIGREVLTGGADSLWPLMTAA